MKRFALIYGLVLALLLVVATGWRMHPAEPEGNELYERYKDMPGVRVGMFKDFMLNDSVAVDVTTFEALDSAGWMAMADSLDLWETIEMSHIMDSMGRADGLPEEAISETFNLFGAVPYHPEMNGYEAIKDLHDTFDAVVVSVHHRWVAVYHCRNNQQLENVVNAHILHTQAAQALPTADGNTIKKR